MPIRVLRRSTAAHSHPAQTPFSARVPGHTPPTPPAYRLLDPSLDHVPSMTELTLLVSEQMVRLNPEVPAVMLERVSRMAAETMLSESAPRVSVARPDPALGEARDLLTRTLPRASNHHLRMVA